MIFPYFEIFPYGYIPKTNVHLMNTAGPFRYFKLRSIKNLESCY